MGATKPLANHGILYPDCGSDRIAKYGKRKGVQWFVCQECYHQFASHKAIRKEV